MVVTLMNDFKVWLSTSVRPRNGIKIGLFDVIIQEKSSFVHHFQHNSNFISTEESDDVERHQLKNWLYCSASTEGNECHIALKF